jgi:hypothetical protein
LFLPSRNTFFRKIKNKITSEVDLFTNLIGNDTTAGTPKKIAAARYRVF